MPLYEFWWETGDFKSETGDETIEGREGLIPRTIAALIRGISIVTHSNF
jgi:hypothetical protein